MSPVNHLSVLAFAAGALAVPDYRDYGHGHGHHHFHGAGSASGSGIPFPYAVANATGVWGSTGTGFATGTSTPTGYSSPVVPFSSSYPGPVVYISPIPASSRIATYGNAASTTECTTDVTITTTKKTYVTVTATEESSSSVEALSTSARSTSTLTVQRTVYYTPSLSASAVFSSSANSSSAAPTAYSPSGPAAYTPQTASSVYSSSTTSSAKAFPVSTAESSSSSEIAPSSYSAAAKAHSPSPPAYSAPAPSSSSTPAPSSYFASTISSSTVVSSAYSTSSTSSSAAATSSTASSAIGGKRGLGYNDASLTNCFMDSPNVGFAYNWVSNSGGFTPSSSVQYIPTLHDTQSVFTSVWSDDANTAISAGAKYLFSFNEPDMSTEANMSPEDAASAWKQYMEPFAGKAQLCAPSVTNGGGEMGLTWLSNFMSACSDCTIDCVNIHWYAESSLTDYFKEQVTNATTVSGKPVFVSEFAPTDGSDDDKSTFLHTVMPWMDSNDDVLGYAYFMVSDGLLVTGTEPSSYGSTYADHTS